MSAPRVPEPQPGGKKPVQGQSGGLWNWLKALSKLLPNYPCVPVPVLPQQYTYITTATTKVANRPAHMGAVETVVTLGLGHALEPELWHPACRGLCPTGLLEEHSRRVKGVAGET